MTLSTSDVVVCRSNNFIQLAGEPRDLCFSVGRRRTATARGLGRVAALYRYRLAASRFRCFAACSGAPSHWLPDMLGTRHLKLSLHTSNGLGVV